MTLQTARSTVMTVTAVGKSSQFTGGMTNVRAVENSTQRGNVMSELAYLGSILLAVGAWAVAGWALWQVVEGAYWVYCKLTGREY